jgi:hypothetical protein
MSTGVKAKYTGLCNLFVTFACYHLENTIVMTGEKGTK